MWLFRTKRRYKLKFRWNTPEKKIWITKYYYFWEYKTLWKDSENIFAENKTQSFTSLNFKKQKEMKCIMPLSAHIHNSSKIGKNVKNNLCRESRYTKKMLLWIIEGFTIFWGILKSSWLQYSLWKRDCCQISLLILSELPNF